MTTNVKVMVALTKLNHALMAKLGKNLEMLGMLPSIYTILAHLNIVRRDKTQNLGEVALITSGTITHIVNKMIKLNLVKKQQDEKDKRVFWISITEEGQKKFQEVNETHLKYLDELLKDFSNDEKNLLIKQLKYFGKKIRSTELRHTNKGEAI